MKFLTFIIMFICLGAFFIISNENLNMTIIEDRQKFQEDYSGWLSNLFNNAKGMTGYVIDSKWLPNPQSKK